MADLNRLLEDYKARCGSMTFKQKAEAERALWDAHCDETTTGQRGHRRDWFAEHLGESGAVYDHRQMMLSAGPWVDPLWKMLDSGTAHYVVVRLFRQARALASERQVPHGQAVQDVIDEYAASGVVSHSSDGRTFRRLSPTEKARAAPPPPSQDEDADFRSMNTQNARTRQFLLRLQLMTDAYLKHSLEDSDSDESIELRMAGEDFISYVREATEDLKRRVNDVRSAVRKEARRQKVSREMFRHACEVLNLPASYGQPVALRACKKIMLKRAASLHPDRNNGSHSARAEYQAVIESYKVLEQYMEGFVSNETGERSHEGR